MPIHEITLWFCKNHVKILSKSYVRLTLLSDSKLIWMPQVFVLPYAVDGRTEGQIQIKPMELILFTFFRLMHSQNSSLCPWPFTKVMKSANKIDPFIAGDIFVVQLKSGIFGKFKNWELRNVESERNGIWNMGIEEKNK